MVLVDAQVGVQHCVLAVDRERLSEVVGGGHVVLLLVEDVTEPPPSVVLPVVRVERLLVAFLCLFECFVFDVFVATQGVGVGEATVELNGSVERFQGCLVLLLEGVTVTKNAPGLRSENASFEGVVADEAKVSCLLLVPEAS